MILAVYVYQTAAGTQSTIDSDDYNYAGTWSASGTYKAATLDTVAYGNARYITIIDNIGGNPTLVPPRNIPKKWSVLAKIREGSEPPWSSGTVAPDVALTALYTAWTGTDLAGTALQTAWAGTTEAHTAWEWARLARTEAGEAHAAADSAYLMAVAGTNAAAQAQSVAEAGTAAAAGAQSTANDALDLAALGSSIANTALQTAWVGTALALQTAWVGTTAGISGTVYAAFQFNGPTDTQLVFTNGILTSWNYPS
jgi:hypothetical protein